MYTRERIRTIRLMDKVKGNPIYIKELGINLSMKKVNSDNKRRLY